MVKYNNYFFIFYEMGLCFSRRRRRIVPKRKLKPPKEKQERLIEDVNTIHRNIIGKTVTTQCHSIVPTDEAGDSETCGDPP